MAINIIQPSLNYLPKNLKKQEKVDQEIKTNNNNKSNNKVV